MNCLQDTEDKESPAQLDEAAAKLIASETELVTERQTKATIPVKEDYFLPEDQGIDEEADANSDVISQQSEDISDLEERADLESDVESEDESDGSDNEEACQDDLGASDLIEDQTKSSRKRKVSDMLNLTEMHISETLLRVYEGPEVSSTNYLKPP